MTVNKMPATDADSNDRLWAALAYLFTPIVPIIILLVESMKARPYQRYHAMQALGLGVVAVIVSIILGATVILALCACLVFIPQLYYAYVAYQGAYFEIPVIGSFMKGQGWLK